MHTTQEPDTRETILIVEDHRNPPPKKNPTRKTNPPKRSPQKTKTQPPSNKKK
jgi:hypothetical protein